MEKNRINSKLCLAVSIVRSTYISRYFIITQCLTQVFLLYSCLFVSVFIIRTRIFIDKQSYYNLIGAKPITLKQYVLYLPVYILSCHRLIFEIFVKPCIEHSRRSNMSFNTLTLSYYCP